MCCVQGGGGASKEDRDTSEDEHEDEHEVEDVVEEIDVDQLAAEAENDYVGECAVDLFIDALNPLSKRIHSTLKTTLERQREAVENMKKDRAEQRAEEIRQQGGVILVLHTTNKTLLEWVNIRAE